MLQVFYTNIIIFNLSRKKEKDEELNIISKYQSFYLQMRFTFTGECRHPEQQIHSCQNVGSQFLIANQKFNITYKACQGMDWTANKGMHNL